VAFAPGIVFLGMHHPDLTIPLIALYAETHFRFFSWMPSLVYRRLPEVIFDMPRRLAPGCDLPILLLVNDVHRFPVEIGTVTIALSQRPDAPEVLVFDNMAAQEILHPLAARQRAFLFTVPHTMLRQHEAFVNAKVELRRNGRAVVVLNDNLPGSSKTGLHCVVARESRPGSAWCSYGDLHVHSQYSQSHVEFGPPVRAIQTMARAHGVDFVALTDHSYDLSCRMDNYLAVDAGESQRWVSAKAEVRASSRSVPTMLMGEEVSCLNARGQVVHLCGVGMSEFIAGSRDGARRNAVNDNMLTIPEVVEAIHKQGGTTLAAHPGAGCGIMQRLFLHRGTWSDTDASAGVDALQAANGYFSRSWDRGKLLWIRALLRGKRIGLAAGTDSHGDFNRYRYLSTPFVSIAELERMYFCGVLTGVYGKPRLQQEIIAAIRNGRTFVTDGPFVTLSASRDPADSVIGTGDVRPEVKSLFVVAASSCEFGPIRSMQVIRGRVGAVEEEMVWHQSSADGDTLEQVQECAVSPTWAPGYLRAVVRCEDRAGIVRQAYTSPCYLSSAE
jgi:hypothetical protein